MSTSVPLPILGARPGAAVLAALACSGAALIAAPAAVATPGDHGDVKVRSVGTPISSPRNETRVCDFYLAGNDFDSVQELTWAIVPQGRSAETSGLSGGISLAGGLGRTEELSLPNGLYKLTWNIEGAGGAGKQKLFTVDCSSKGAPGASSAPAAPSDDAEVNPEAGREPTDEAQSAPRAPDEAETDDQRTHDAEDIPGADGPETSGTDRAADDEVVAEDQQAQAAADERAASRDRAEAPSGAVGAGGGGVADHDKDDGGLSGAVITGAVAAGAAGAAGLFLVRRARRRNHGTV